MYCKQCGKRAEATDKFCVGCGIPVAFGQGGSSDPWGQSRVGQPMNAPQGDAWGSFGGQNNTMAILGLVFAFFFPLLGVIFSIIGLGRAKQMGNGRGIAIAGLVISIVMIAINIFLLVWILNRMDTWLDELYRWQNY